MRKEYRYMSLKLHFKYSSGQSPTESERTEANTHPAIAALRRISVSKVFRRSAWELFPDLKKNRGYWPLFCYLLFGSWHDENTSRLLLCAPILSEIEGRDPNNSQAEKFLIRFQDDVLRPVE